MLKINVSSNIKEVKKELSKIEQQQIPFAASKTLNQIAFKAAREVLPKDADKTFQGGATRFTQRGFKYTKSNKRNLTAWVFIDPVTHDYMRFMVQGGRRFPEKRAILATTMHSKLNKHGNMPRSLIQSIISDKQKFFKGVPKGIKVPFDGVWERYGPLSQKQWDKYRAKKTSKNRQQYTYHKRIPGKPRRLKIRMVAYYADSTGYRPVFPFGKFVEGVVFSRNDRFAKQFRKNLEDAIKTAR